MCVHVCVRMVVRVCVHVCARAYTCTCVPVYMRVCEMEEVKQARGEECGELVGALASGRRSEEVSLIQVRKESRGEQGLPKRRRAPAPAPAAEPRLEGLGDREGPFLAPGEEQR